MLQLFASPKDVAVVAVAAFMVVFVSLSVHRFGMV
jgi:hypothetical protein